MEKIQIVYSPCYRCAGKKLTRLFRKNKKEFDIVKFKSSKNFFEDLKTLSQNINAGIVNRAIVVDSYGSQSFMFLSKQHGLVVAQISDEHSGHMTAEHNGSNCICLGSEILSTKQMHRISLSFLNDKFAAGRHMSRLDMLTTISKGGN